MTLAELEQERTRLLEAFHRTENPIPQNSYTWKTMRDKLQRVEAEINRLKSKQPIPDLWPDPWPELDALLATKTPQQQIDELRQKLMAAGNLLAIIHRDGGQYISDHGFTQACLDASDLVNAATNEMDRMRVLCDSILTDYQQTISSVIYYSEAMQRITNFRKQMDGVARQ